MGRANPVRPVVFGGTIPTMSDYVGSDPFTQFESLVRDALYGHSPMADLVKLGNRIDFVSDNQSPDKKNTASADYPQLRLKTAGTQMLPKITTSAAACIHVLEVDIATNRSEIHESYNKVKWQLLRALVVFHEQVVPEMGWITNISIDPVDIEEQLAQAGGEHGWVGVARIVGEFSFDIQGDMIAGSAQFGDGG